MVVESVDGARRARSGAREGRHCRLGSHVVHFEIGQVAQGRAPAPAPGPGTLLSAATPKIALETLQTPYNIREYR